MTDQERLRIAVALAALRHKPADQSCASYVLELHQRFPLKPCKPDACAIDASGPWRVRVQGLEQALRDLQDKYNAQRVDLAALQATRSLSIGDPDTTPSCPAPTPVPGKKKSRKKAAPGRVPQAKNTNEGSRVADMRGPWSSACWSPFLLMAAFGLVHALILYARAQTYWSLNFLARVSCYRRWRLWMRFWILDGDALPQ
ncbi:hypothetical protein PHLGIDRAFT_211710 [Phlebiopsis gigantea 11061_1 CR5-6]|uniref:Uncharacterized protein n=1 Tax=Phlebiopsis gigantea (strain 11061_1 CR5-6) TaxID=745531 RepID=A0A0C3PEW2_PHLG1|nr:hypothetical protein PHLGIDRAFT_211710 [Phlebiopsis gigantea 11061_1 CR5-6]